MNQYWQVVKNTWDEMVSYRLNFSVWRLRVVLQYLTIYFLWTSLIPSNGSLFGYSQPTMVTYIFGVAFLSSLVLSTRTYEIGDSINSGQLSFFLIRPSNYFAYWLARDLGDKLMNISFSIVELLILFLILQPHLFLQKDPVYLALAILSALFGSMIYFLFGTLLGFIGFWSSEVWAPRFIFFILISFFAGNLFPLDILPKPVFNIFQLLPFPYMVFFPMKIYLGQLPLSQIMIGILISATWVGALFLFAKFIWQKGIQLYSAQGQ